MRLCRMREGSPIPPHHLYLWQKWGKWIKDHRGSRWSKTCSPSQSSCSSSLLPALYPPVSAAILSLQPWSPPLGVSLFGLMLPCFLLCKMGYWWCLPPRPLQVVRNACKALSLGSLPHNWCSTHACCFITTQNTTEMLLILKHLG